MFKCSIVFTFFSYVKRPVEAIGGGGVAPFCFVFQTGFLVSVGYCEHLVFVCDLFLTGFVWLLVYKHERLFSGVIHFKVSRVKMC